MHKSEIKKILNQYIDITKQKVPCLKIALITSIKNETEAFNDFTFHSVTTSYLSKSDCNELINLFRENNIYVELYPDWEHFFKDFYNNKFHCNIVFESSPKGIAKGKDAIIPAFCDSVGISHVGPDAAANLRCGNKYQWYCILRINDIPVPDTYLYTSEWNKKPLSKGKYILKLNEECASIGLTKNSVFTNNVKEMTDKAREMTKIFDEPVIAQSFIHGYEVEVPLIANAKYTIALPPVGLQFNQQHYLKDMFFDYNNIDKDEYGVYLFEEENKDISEHLQKTTVSIAKLLNLHGFFRVDYRVDCSGNYYVIDINNDPTLNAEGSFQFSVQSLGYEKKDIISIILGNYFFNRTNIECQ